MDLLSGPGSGGMQGMEGAGPDQGGYPPKVYASMQSQVHKHVQSLLKGKHPLPLKGRSVVFYPDAYSLPNPTPVDFLLSNSHIYIWSPSETHPYLCKEILCPKCDQVATTTGWSQRVRVVTHFDRSRYVYYRKYLCKACNKAGGEYPPAVSPPVQN